MINRLRCLLGSHAWTTFENPESAGAAPPYLVCSRCGKDKPQYDPPTEGQARGLGGGA